MRDVLMTGIGFFGCLVGTWIYERYFVKTRKINTREDLAELIEELIAERDRGSIMNQAIVEKQTELVKVLQDKAIQALEMEIDSLKYTGQRLVGKDAEFPVCIFNTDVQESIKGIIWGEAPSQAEPVAALIAEKMIQEAAKRTDIS